MNDDAGGLLGEGDWLVRAAGVHDAQASCEPGAVLIRVGEGSLRVLAAGAPDSVDRHPASAGAGRVDLPGAVLVPGLVNAHTHLDLTHIGPRAFDADAGFTGWAQMVIAERRHADDGIAASVAEGVRRCLLGGVVAVGDIAGDASDVPRRAAEAGGLAGVSYREYFGIGGTAGAAASALTEQATTDARTNEAVVSSVRALRFGTSPHAPYTAGTAVLNAAAEAHRAHGVRVCTHLSETPEERAFIERGTGAFRTLLETLGVWDDAVAQQIGHGRSPIEHATHAMGRCDGLVAHVNDCPDRDLERLAESGLQVVYCPRSSDYFGRHEDFGPHRYREMLDAGVNVCLGTDSIINLDAQGGETLSSWEEARFLFERDNTDARLLLEMATINGARALGIDPELVTFGEGELLGVVAIEVEGGAVSGAGTLERALRSRARPRLIAHPMAERVHAALAEDWKPVINGGL